MRLEDAWQEMDAYCNMLQTSKKRFRLLVIACCWAICVGVGTTASGILAQQSDRSVLDIDLQMRLRRSAAALAAAEQTVATLQEQLSAENRRSVSSEVERELNRETVAGLDRQYAEAQVDLRKRQEEFKTVKEESDQIQEAVRRAEERRKAEERHQADAPSAPLPSQQVVPTPAPASAVASTPVPHPSIPDSKHLARDVQSELLRLGCEPGVPDGAWGPGSQRALQLFNNSANARHELAAPSEAALLDLRSRRGRVCPLTCKSGFKIENGACIAISCPAGQTSNAAGVCLSPPPPALSVPARLPVPPSQNNEEVVTTKVVANARMQVDMAIRLTNKDIQSIASGQMTAAIRYDLALMKESEADFRSVVAKLSGHRKVRPEFVVLVQQEIQFLRSAIDALDQAIQFSSLGR